MKVALGDKSVPEKSTENETALSSKADEAGRVIASPATTKKMAGHTAKGKVKTSAMNSIEVEAEMIGLPYLKARETIAIENVGKKFSGDWRITKIRHQISSGGHFCSLSLARNDHAGKKKSKNKPKQSASTKGTAKNETNNANVKPAKTKIDLNTGQVIKN